MIKLHEVLIEITQFKDVTTSKTEHHEQRAITPEGMVQYGPLCKSRKNIMILNSVTKFHKVLIKIIQLQWRADVSGAKYGRTGITLNAQAIFMEGA